MFLPKVSIKVLRTTGDTQTYLLKLEAGAILLPHDHPMDEECMVLEGEVRIGDVVARACENGPGGPGLRMLPFRSQA